MSAQADPVTPPATEAAPTSGAGTGADRKAVAIPQDHDVPAGIRDQELAARLMAGATMLPRHFKTVADLMVAQRAAMALRVPVWCVIDNMFLIEGRPGYQADFIRAMVIRAGHRIRVTARTKERAEVTIWRCDDPLPYVSEFTWEDAVTADLATKATWKRYPRAMMVARATTLAIREACPDVMFGGAYTAEELGATVDEDGHPVAIQAERVPEVVTEVTEPDPKEMLRRSWRADIEKATTTAALEGLKARAHMMGILTSVLYPDGMTVEEAITRRGTEITGDGDIHDAEVVADEDTESPAGSHEPPCETVDEDTWRADIRAATTDEDLDELWDRASKAGILDSPLYPDGMTVEQAINKRDTELPGDSDEAEAPGDVPPPEGPGDEQPPVPDDPERCKMTAARRGVLKALADGGDVKSLVQVEFGLPLDQVSTSRLRALLTSIGRAK